MFIGASKSAKFSFHFFQNPARPQKRKRVENFEVFELRWEAEAEATQRKYESCACPKTRPAHTALLLPFILVSIFIFYL
jgi:hypothetical protein